MLEPMVEIHKIIPVRKLILFPDQLTMCLARTSVAPVYFKVPAWAKRSIKNNNVHHSTSFSIYSRAFLHFQSITQPLEKRGVISNIVLGSKFQSSSKRWCMEIKKMVTPKIAKLIFNSLSGGTDISLISISLAPSSLILLSKFASSLLYQNFTITIKIARQTIIRGKALKIKSSKVKPDFAAISMPIGLPRTVPLEPMFVAKTAIIKNGTGSTSK